MAKKSIQAPRQGTTCLVILILAQAAITDWNVAKFQTGPDMFRLDSRFTTLSRYYRGIVSTFATEPSDSHITVTQPVKSKLSSTSVPTGCTVFESSMFETSVLALCGTKVYFGAVDSYEGRFNPKFSKKIEIAGVSACADMAVNNENLSLFVVCEVETAGDEVQISFTEIDVQKFELKKTSAAVAFGGASGAYKLHVVEASGGSDLIVLETGEAFKGTAYQYLDDGTIPKQFDLTPASLPMSSEVVNIDSVATTLAVMKRDPKDSKFVYGVAFCTADFDNSDMSCPTAKVYKINNDTPVDSAELKINQLYQVDRSNAVVAYLHFRAQDAYTLCSLKTGSGSVSLRIQHRLVLPVGYESTNLMWYSNGQYFIIGKLEGQIQMTSFNSAATTYQSTLSDLDENSTVMISMGKNIESTLVIYGFKGKKCYYSALETPGTNFRPAGITQEIDSVTFSFVANQPDGQKSVSDKITLNMFKNFDDGLALETPDHFSVYTGGEYELPVGEKTTGNGPNYQLTEAPTSIDVKIEFIQDGSIELTGGLDSESFDGALQLDGGYYVSNTLSAGNKFVLFKCAEVAGDLLKITCEKVADIDANISGATGQALVAGDYYNGKACVWITYTNSASQSAGVIQIIDVQAGTATSHTYTGEKEAYAVQGTEDSKFILLTSEQHQFKSMTSSRVQVRFLNFEDPTGEFEFKNPTMLNFHGQLCINKLSFTAIRSSKKVYIGSKCAYHTSLHPVFKSLVESENTFDLDYVYTGAVNLWCNAGQKVHTINPADSQLGVTVRTTGIHNSVTDSGAWVTPIYEYFGATEVNSVLCGNGNFVYLDFNGAESKKYMMMLDARQIGYNNRRRLHSVTELPAEFDGKQLSFFTNADRTMTYLFSTANNFGKVMAFRVAKPALRINLGETTESSTEIVKINLLKYDGSSVLNTEDTNLKIFSPFTQGTIRKKEGKEIKIENNGQEQIFVLDEYLDFIGPVTNIEYTSPSGAKNTLLPRQRKIDSPFAFLKEKYTGVNILGNKAIVWDSETKVVRFLQQNGEQSEVVQEINGEHIESEIIDAGADQAFTAIVSNEGTYTLYTNFEGNGLSNAGISQSFPDTVKLLELNAGDQSLVVAWYDKPANQFNFQKAVIGADALALEESISSNLEANIFDCSLTSTNNKVILAYTLVNSDNLHFITVAEDQNAIAASTSVTLPIDLAKFNTYFSGRHSRIACSESDSPTVLHCAICDSVFNAFFIDVSVDTDSIPTSTTATSSFIIPAGFQVQKMIRNKNVLFWSGTNPNKLNLPKEGTLLSSAYLLLLYREGESEHAVVTLNEDLTGVPIENFETLSPFLSEENGRPVLNFNSGEAGETGAMRAVELNKFEWVISDPAAVDLSKDKFEVEGYDPEDKQEVETKDVAEEEGGGGGGNNGSIWLILIICLVVIVLIVVFLVCCVYGGKRKKRKAAAGSMGAESLGEDKDAPLIPDDGA